MGLDQLLQSSYLFSKQKAILPTISSSSTTHAQLKRHLSWSAAYYRWLQFLLAILHFLRIFRILAFFCHFGELLVFKACREFNFCRDFCKKSGLAKNLAIYKNPQFCNSLKFWSFISKSYEMTVVSLPLHSVFKYKVCSVGLFLVISLLEMKWSLTLRLVIYTQLVIAVDISGLCWTCRESHK